MKIIDCNHNIPLSKLRGILSKKSPSPDVKISISGSRCEIYHNNIRYTLMLDSIVCQSALLKHFDKLISLFGPETNIWDLLNGASAKRRKERKKATADVIGSTKNGDKSHGGENASREVADSPNSADHGRNKNDGRQTGESDQSVTATSTRPDDGADVDACETGADRADSQILTALQDASHSCGEQTLAVKDGQQLSKNTEAETVSEKNGQDLASDDLLDVAKNYDNTEEHDSKDYLGDAVSQTPAFPVTRKSGGMDNIASVKGVDHHGGNHLNRDASASIPFRYAKRLKRRIEALISFHCAGIEEESRNVNGKKLVTEIVTKRYNLNRIYRQNRQKKPALLAIDVSGSCHVTCNYTLAVAVAIAREMPETVKLLIHSNGYPCQHKSLLTNGIQLATDWMGDWSLCLAWGDLDAIDALNKIGAKCQTILFDDYCVKVGDIRVNYPCSDRSFIWCTGVRGADKTLSALSLLSKA
jgi:hypothetical protein